MAIAVEMNCPSGLILDLSLADERGEYPVIDWDNGPIARYRDIYELLESEAEYWESLLLPLIVWNMLKLNSLKRNPLY